jgi:hypothetical protein
MPTGIVIAAVVTIIVLGVLVVIQMIAITALLFVIKNLAQEIRERVEPLVVKVNDLLLTANEVAQTVQGKTEHIAEKTAHTADVVTDRVEKTSGLLQGLLSSPIIRGAATATGMSRGYQAWREARQKRDVTTGVLLFWQTTDANAPNYDDGTNHKDVDPVWVSGIAGTSGWDKPKNGANYMFETCDFGTVLGIPTGA